MSVEQDLKDDKNDLSDLDEQLYRAIEEGDLGETTLLLDKGANIDARNTNRETPLLRALRAGNISLARFLLEQGADATLKDNNGFDAFFTVAYSSFSPDKNPGYTLMEGYWKERYLNARPIPSGQERMFLEAYSCVFWHKAFLLKNGAGYKGYYGVEEDKEELDFSWAPSPMDSPGMTEEDYHETIAIADIDINSLHW